MCQQAELDKDPDILNLSKTPGYWGPILSDTLEESQTCHHREGASECVEPPGQEMQTKLKSWWLLRKRTHLHSPDLRGPQGQKEEAPGMDFYTSALGPPSMAATTGTLLIFWPCPRLPNRRHPTPLWGLSCSSPWCSTALCNTLPNTTVWGNQQEHLCPL